MRRSEMKAPIVLALILLLVQLPVLGAGVPVGKVSPRSGASLLNGGPLVAETTLYPGDRVATELEGMALIQLSQGDQLLLDSESAATVNSAGKDILVSLERGGSVARSGNGRQVAVSAGGLLVRPSGKATYGVSVEGNSVVVASEKGSVEVAGTNRTVLVASGKAMKFETTADASQAPVGVGAGGGGGVSAAAVAGIVAAVAVASVTTALAIKYNNDKNDARDACQDIARSASPPQPVPPECQ